ncbi:hypothetical protein Droror1_Dr00026590 [Drosera rotundifolia]
MTIPYKLSKDGVELQFVTNLTGHFLLTNLLLDVMKKTGKESNREGRIVILSSEAHRYAYKEGIRFDKINDESGMLGFEYKSKRGYLGLEYHGRTVGIKIMPVGIHMGRIQASMIAAQEQKIAEIKKQFEGKKVLLGVDNMDIFKAINLKVLAMEQLLKQQPQWQLCFFLNQLRNLLQPSILEFLAFCF